MKRGFVQQLATNILTHGYFFYVQGHVREGKDSREIDKKLLVKYGVEMSRSQRARRKLLGLANIHYPAVRPALDLTGDARGPLV